MDMIKTTSVGGFCSLRMQFSTESIDHAVTSYQLPYHANKLLSTCCQQFILQYLYEISAFYRGR